MLPGERGLLLHIQRQAKSVNPIHHVRSSLAWSVVAQNRPLRPPPP